MALHINHSLILHSFVEQLRILAAWNTNRSIPTWPRRSSAISIAPYHTYRSRVLSICPRATKQPCRSGCSAMDPFQLVRTMLPFTELLIRYINLRLLYCIFRPQCQCHAVLSWRCLTSLGSTLQQEESRSWRTDCRLRCLRLSQLPQVTALLDCQELVGTTLGRARLLSCLSWRQYVRR